MTKANTAAAPAMQPKRQWDANEQLRSHGLRPTVARLLVWRLLYEAGEPLSVHDLQRGMFAQKASTPFNTMYLALRQMEEKGLVKRLRVDGENRSHYTLVANVQFSQSITCSRCGAQQWADDAAVREAIEAACRKRGLRLVHYQLHVQVGCGNECPQPAMERPCPMRPSPHETARR